MAQFIAQKPLHDFLQETEDAINAGRIDTALAHCQTILASFPESLEAQCLLGEVYLAQGRLEEALYAFDWVLTNDPEHVIAYCNRAIVSVRMSDIDTALDCYQQAYELSRGDGQIRQEFTQLSAKAGQQGFVYSRAGLARLYMRGGLLSQAIQEWQVVLTATPERLDARTGLLETYWREGFWDEVEELANQILRDIAGCLKALLLLAHVTASKDMAQAQALLQQAEALDPDLVMAQELFAAMLAHYPDDPFLMLLKKSPSVVNTSPTPNILSQANSQTSAAILSQSGQISLSQTDAVGSPGTNSQWGDAQGWSTNATFLPPLSDAQLQHNNGIPWAMGQSNGDATALDLEHSDLAAQLSSDRISRDPWPMQERFSPLAAQSEEYQPEPWEMLQDALQNRLSVAQSEEEYQPEPWEMLQDALQNRPSVAQSEEYQPEPWEMLQDALQSRPSVAQSAGYQPEPWAMLQNASHTISDSTTGQGQGQSESQQWEDQNGVSNLDGGQESWESQSGDIFSERNNSWVSPVGSYEVQRSDWPVNTQANNPPSWLSMLTQVDRKETTLATPFEYTSSASIQPEEIPASPPLEPVTHQPATSLPSSLQAQESEFASSPVEEDDESGFGPAWLKSLGATILEDEVPHLEQVAPSTSPLSPASEKPEQPTVNVSQNAFEVKLQEQPDAEFGVSSAANEPWWLSSSESQQLAHEAHKLPDMQEQVKAPESESQPSTSASWQVEALERHKQPSTAELNLQVQLAASDPEKIFTSRSQPESLSSSSSVKVEQDLVATLEELEQQLYAKGFVAMEPNSLSAIAQTEEAMTAITLIPLSTEQPSQPIQETSQEQLLPSALAELGIMLHRSVDGAETPVSSTVSTSDAADFSAEPLWFQTLHSASAPEVDESIASPAFSTPIVSRPVPSLNVSQQRPNISQRHLGVMPEQIFEPVSASVSLFTGSQQLEASNGHTNPLLDTELEMTMKRPAVRLQSMLYSEVSYDTVSASSKEPIIERGEPPPVDKVVMEYEHLNYQDRLLKGYQHQLVGDYDEAIQDYRLVIRSAPELLGEVISNLRALLKQAPKCSIGYRVLGDAYMRQGEYLQAMESYNNALTMTKKTRS